MLFESAKRTGKPKKTIIFDALEGVRVPSTQDTKNPDAVDLLVEAVGKKGKVSSKVYTFRPDAKDAAFFQMIVKYAQPNKGSLDFAKMPEDDAVVDRLYAQVLDHLAIPEGQRQAMMAQKKSSKV